MKKYSVTIIDRGWWDVIEDEQDADSIIKSGILVEDRFLVVVEANNRGEARKKAHKMYYKIYWDDAEYCLSEEGCDWWENSEANPDSEWSKAFDEYGIGFLQHDYASLDFEITEVKNEK